MQEYLKDQSKFRKLAEMMSDYIFELTAQDDGTFSMEILAGDYYGSTGYRLEDVKSPGQWSKTMHPDDLSKLDQTLHEVIQSRKQCEFECRSFSADGNMRWIEVLAIPDSEPVTGKLLSIYGYVKNITERKNNEENLRKSEEKYRSIFNNIQDAYYEATLDGILLEISPSIEKISRGVYTREELIGHSIVQFYQDPGQRDLFYAQISRSGMVHDFEIAMYLQNDIVVNLSVNAFLKLDENGKPEKIVGSFRDITERTRVQAQLQKSERQYKTLTENMQDVVWTMDPETQRFLYVSPSVLKLRGYTQEEVMAQSMAESLTPGQANLIFADLQERLAALRSGLISYDTYFLQEVLQPRKDGTAIWTEISTHFWFNELTGKIEIHGVARDISKRKLSEEALQKSEEKYSRAFQTSPYVITVTQAEDGKIIDVNDAFERTIGYTKEEALSGAITVYDLWVNADERNKAVARIQKEKTVHGFEAKFRRSDGVILDSIFSASLTMIDQKPYILSSINDITAQKKAEQVLKESHEMLEQMVADRTRELSNLSTLQKAILNYAGVGIITTKPDRMIQVFNPAAEKMFGYKADEMEGKQQPHNLMDPEEALQFYHQHTGKLPDNDEALVNCLFQEIYGKTTEWTFVRKDGSKFPAKLTLTSFDDGSGKVEGMIGIISDISKEKQALVALQKSEEQFHKMFHDHTAVMLLLNPQNGDIVDANNSAKEFYGYDFSDKPINIGTLNPLPKATIHELLNSSSFRKRNYFEFSHRLASGEFRTVEAHATPIQLHNEKLIFAIIHDISERKLVEIALKNSEKTLRQITDHVPVFIALTNNNLEYIFVNREYERFFDINRLEMIGKRVDEIVDEQAFERAKPYLERALAGESNTFENQITNRHGKQIIAQTTYSPYYQNNKIAGILATVLDITERVNADRLLRKSEEENRAILSAVPDLMFRLNRQGILLGTHTGDPGELYLPPEEFLGKRVDEVLPENVASVALRSLDEAFSKQDLVSFEYELIINGETRYYENRMLPISADEALSIIRDITDRKKAEKELLWNESLLKMMTASSPLAFLVIDNRTDEILYFNHNFCEIWGISHLEERMRNKELKNNDIIPDCLPVLKDVPAFVESCKPVQDVDNRAVLEDEICFNDGRIIRRFSAQIRDDQDEYHGRLYIFEDITQRKNSENHVILQRDLSTRLSVIDNLQDALTTSLDAISKIENVDAAGIYLIDPLTSATELIVHFGLSDKFAEATRIFPADSPQTKMTLAGNPVYFDYNDKTMEVIPGNNDGLISVAIIPLRNEGVVIGSINLGTRTVTKYFEEIHLFLESIALHLGGAFSRIISKNALLASQQNFQMLFNTIDDFMFIIDAGGYIMQTNQIVLDRLGYTEEELKGLHVLSVHPPDRREEAGFIIIEMIAGRAAFCPVPLFTKDGRNIPVETRVVPGKWDEKAVLFGISRDITERQKAEAALKESEARWNFALEGSGDGVWDWNAVTNEVFFSHQWKTMFGYADNEIGNNLSEWESRVHPDDLASCYADLEKHFSGESEIYMNEHRVLCKDHTYKWILDRGKVVAWQPDGKPARVIGTHTDITDRKQLEANLRNSIIKERELNDLKSRFVSMASHEFRTPLASILMSDETLISYWKKMDEEQVMTKLFNIREQVEHLTNIVTDVMQVSKIQEGMETVDARPVDFVALCNNVIHNFNTGIGHQQRIAFQSTFEKLNMLLDTRLMQQVLNNLISNALKYSPAGPKIRVRLTEETDDILLTIADQGIGIPAADQPNLFQPFFRASNVKQIQGNGLGMNIVKESVGLHDGTISFTSSTGNGTTFYIRLPRRLIILDEI